MIVKEDMKTARQGRIFTILQRGRRRGRVQDMLRPSTRVRGREQTVRMSDIARWKIKIFLAVLVSFLLKVKFTLK